MGYFIVTQTIHNGISSRQQGGHVSRRLLRLPICLVRVRNSERARLLRLFSGWGNAKRIGDPSQRTIGIAPVQGHSLDFF